jgi:hypothetical protein
VRLWKIYDGCGFTFFLLPEQKAWESYLDDLRSCQGSINTTLRGVIPSGPIRYSLGLLIEFDHPAKNILFPTLQARTLPSLEPSPYYQPCLTYHHGRHYCGLEPHLRKGAS